MRKDKRIFIVICKETFRISVIDVSKAICMLVYKKRLQITKMKVFYVFVSLYDKRLKITKKKKEEFC